MKIFFVILSLIIGNSACASGSLNSLKMILENFDISCGEQGYNLLQIRKVEESGGLIYFEAERLAAGTVIPTKDIYWIGYLEAQSTVAKLTIKNESEINIGRFTTLTVDIDSLEKYEAQEELPEQIQISSHNPVKLLHDSKSIQGRIGSFFSLSDVAYAIDGHKSVFGMGKPIHCYLLRR